MIPHTEQHNLDTGGAVGESKEYSFEMNAHMASLLSDKLYSNKVEAIIRELACNAQDSHIEANNSASIDVHLPTAIEPFFYIEDFGIGLNHEDVMNLYTTYGASTKRGTNAQVGQFGLGSKVFFAYTDQATITATKDGIRQIYSAFKDEEGMPNITTMGAAIHDNSLPDGVKVYVGVLPGDIEAFTGSAQQIFRRFDPRPNILGGSGYEIEEYESVIDGTGWLMRKEDTGYYNKNKSQPCAIQGNVAYRISEEEMKTHMEGTGLQFMLDIPFDIIFKIGELDVSSSREELSYNKQTIAAIITRFGDIHNELRQTIIPDLFNDCTTKWEATKVLATLCSGSKSAHYTELIREAAVYDGADVDSRINLNLKIKNPMFNANGTQQHRLSTNPFITRFRGITVIKLNEREFSLKTSSFSKDQVRPREITLDGNHDHLILWDDKTKSRQPSRLKKYMNDEYGEATRSHYTWSSGNKNSIYPEYVYVIQCDNESQMKAVAADLGDHPYKEFNKIVPELPKVVKVKQPGGKQVRKANKVTHYSGLGYRHYGNEREQLRAQWEDVEVDITTQTKGYYVNLHAWTIKDDRLRTPFIAALYRMAKAIEIVDTHEHIYGVPGSVKNPFEALPGWSNLLDEVESRTLEWFKDPVNCAAVATKNALELEDADYEEKKEIRHVKDILTRLNEDGIIPVGSVAKDFSDYFDQQRLKIELIVGYVDIQDTWLASEDIARMLAKEDKNKKSILKTLLKHRTEFYDKYPMSRFIDEDRIESDDVNRICQYIKQMEK